MERISATQAARNFSELLNRVAYQGQRFEVERGKTIVATIEPAPTSTQGIPIQTLNEVFATLPSLGDDAQAFADDVGELRKALPSENDPWA